MNHAGEKKTLTIVSALGLIIVVIAITYLVIRLGHYESRLSMSPPVQASSDTPFALEIKSPGLNALIQP